MEIPSSFYYLIGSLIIANIGAIGSMAVVAFRATWWLSKLDSRVSEAKATAVRAHKRIDKVTGEEE